MSLRRPTVACLSFIFCYKPFRWCRPDARLRHYYSCSFLSRSHSDPRLAPVLLFLQFPLEESFRPSFGTQYLFWDFGRTTARLLCYYPHALLISMSERTCYSAHMLHVYICYILCPNCLASTFIVLTWLVDLARC